MDSFLLTDNYPVGYERLVMSKREISRIRQWATSASVEEIITVLKSCEANMRYRVLIAVESQDRSKYNTVCRKVNYDVNDVQWSEEYQASSDHERMLPDTVWFSPISEPPTPGTVINGSWLVINNEDPAFPTCLVNGELTSGFNAKVDTPHWVPEEHEAWNARHYDWNMVKERAKKQKKRDAAFRKRLKASQGGY